MRLRYRVLGVAVVALAVLWLVNPPGARAPRGAAPVATSTRAAVPVQRDPAYDEAIDAAHRDGLRVWIETDLVKRWLAGSASFQAAIGTIAEEAGRPGVVGIKIADELGYHDGLTTPGQIDAFLDASAAALRSAARGKLILIDMIIPEMACLPDYQPPLRWATICAAQQRGLYPQLALTEVDGYLARHDVDVLDMSTGLFTGVTYSGWGVDENTAQRAAWREAHLRGWDRLVTLQGRRAMAHPGNDTDSAAVTATEVATFVDIPHEEGAAAVDIWTWRQLYQGQLYRVLDPGLHDNALWDALATRHAAGVRLFTHISPHSVETSLDTDLHKLAEIFTDVFVAAGTG